MTPLSMFKKKKVLNEVTIKAAQYEENCTMR